MGKESQTSPLVKVASVLFVGLTWTAVILNAVSHFSAPPAPLTEPSPRQEVLSSQSASSTSTPPAVSIPVPTPTPVQPIVRGPIPPTPTPSPTPTGSQETRPTFEVGSMASASRDTTSPNVTSQPVSGSRFVPRVIEVSGARPGSTFSLSYRLPSGEVRRLVTGAFVDASGYLRLAVVPAVSFTGITKGPWTMFLCSEAAGSCWTVPVIVSDGNAEVIQRAASSMLH
jgi:hypothetical protein